MKRWWLTYGLFSLLFLSAATQENKTQSSIALEPRVHYGFIIPHRAGMTHLIKGHVRAFELNYDVQTLGNKKWQQLYNYPTWGVSFYHGDLANPEQLGSATGLYPYLKFPFVNTKKFKFNYRIGWGLGYVSKTFHRTENYKNTIIGSNINAIIGMLWETQFRFSKQLNGSLGIGLTHFSNGAYKQPNLGINLPSVNLGVNYAIGDKAQYIKDTTSVEKKNFDVYLIGAGGVKEISIGKNKKYPTLVASIHLLKYLSQKGGFMAGLDVFYDSSLDEKLAHYSVFIDNQFQIIQSGFNLDYVVTVGKVHILFGMGAYLLSKYKGDGLYYHRIGSRIAINDKWLVNATLKTHWFKADYMEIGLGYKLIKR
ncbi:MAG: hypothetical protein COA57_13400 [Flavobacteriales bacterium]|nr:acyloxyacyl hydrolase [Bacteroidales bacterium AH-315-I05]PCJ82161.1 MAG: hypothetical protein COA57_13400 [Flavobacteriales bacterium]